MRGAGGLGSLVPARAPLPERGSGGRAVGGQRRSAVRVLRRGLGSVAVAAMALACLVAPAGATPVATPSVAWTRQFGTVHQDYIGDIDSASNGTFATGILGGGVFLRRYRVDGTVAWNRTFIQSDADYPGSVDAYGDSVYVAGSLTHESGFHTDGFLRKFTAGGTLQWSRFPGSPGIEYVDSVKATGNGVYVAGHTYGQIGTTAPRGQADAFLIRYSHAGAVQWVKQFGTAADDVVSGIAITPAGVVVAGSTAGQLGGQTSAGDRDSYVRTYAFDGTHRWTRQFGSPGADAVIGAVVDRGAIYVVGETTGRLGPGDAGGADAFIRKLGADGSTQWTRQFGGAARDAAYDVEAAGGSIYVTGETEGAIPGGQHRGGRDAFARRYSPVGGVSWTHQFGGSGDDSAFAIDANTSGVYVGGATSSALSGSNKGATD